VLVLLLAAWRYLPEWLQESLSRAGRYAVAVTIGAYGVATGSFWVVVGAGVGAILTAAIADELDCWWLFNNALALGLAIYFAAGTGIVLGPVIIGVGLVGLAVYDYVFADRAEWMFSLAESAMRRKLPLLVVVPPTVQYDWDAFIDREHGDESGWGIGMADLLLPAAFAVSLVDAGGLLAVGVTAGTLLACVRVSWKLEQGGGAGLPPLVTGALGGWAVAAVVGVMLP
jgi:presenilin-like A22 family membrane protease